MASVGIQARELKTRPRSPKTAAALLNSIAEALNKDGASVDPEDIDGVGLWIMTCDGYRYRLHLADDNEAELVDHDTWRERFLPTDTEWMGDIGDIPF